MHLEEPTDKLSSECLLVLRDVNKEVVALQAELSRAVAARPALVGPVRPECKESVFALAAAVLRAAALRAERRFADAPGDGEEAGLQTELDFVLAAAAWEYVAVPSFEARLLRLCCLMDAALLRDLLQAALIAPCLLLASGRPWEGRLRGQCARALQSLWPPRWGG